MGPLEADHHCSPSRRTLGHRGRSYPTWLANENLRQILNTLCKHEAGIRQQLALFHTYHNFVLPHASLRLPLSDAIHGTGSVKRWPQRTPAMAAGLTDRVWNLREVLRYRVPPWPQPQGG